jgi:hypothetical protein
MSRLRDRLPPVFAKTERWLFYAASGINLIRGLVPRAQPMRPGPQQPNDKAVRE